MRAVLQRTTAARVTVDGQTVGSIGLGWLVLVGIAPTDAQSDAAKLADRIAGLRAFADEAGKMNLNLNVVQGSVLVVSNFTLYADCRKGRRPSFTQSAAADVALPIYEMFLRELRLLGVPVQAGVFGADMRIELVNDGPVTFVLDTTEF